MLKQLKYLYLHNDNSDSNITYLTNPCLILSLELFLIITEFYILKVKDKEESIKQLKNQVGSICWLISNELIPTACLQYYQVII